MALKIEVGMRVRSRVDAKVCGTVLKIFEANDLSEGWCYVRWKERDSSDSFEQYSYAVTQRVLICRNCDRWLEEHDEQTGKCLFGAGEWH